MNKHASERAEIFSGKHAPGARIEVADRALRLPDVILIVKLQKGAIHKLMRQDEFPQSFTLIGRSVAWSEREVLAWLSERIKSGRPQKALPAGCPSLTSLRSRAVRLGCRLECTQGAEGQNAYTIEGRHCRGKLVDLAEVAKFLGELEAKRQGAGRASLGAIR